MNRRQFLYSIVGGAIGLSFVRCTASGAVLYNYDRHRIGRTAPGIDFAVNVSPPYTEIVPCAAGWVWDTGWDDDAGEYITAAHGTSYYTMYAHLKERFVTEGAPVNRNTVMALGGNTGRNSRGVWHLHLGFLVPEYAWDDDFMSPGGGMRWANPDAFSESRKRLEYWSGSDLDTAFQQEVKAAMASIDSFWDYLIERESRVARVLGVRRVEFSFDRALSFLERAYRTCDRCTNSHDTLGFLERVNRLKRIRPILTSPFPNPTLEPQYIRPHRLSGSPASRREALKNTLLGQAVQKGPDATKPTRASLEEWVAGLLQ